MIQNIKKGQFIIDMSTSQPDLMVELEKEATARKAYFADAPIARTRQAAVDGTLAIMVGSEKIVFQKILPVLECMGQDIMFCGKAGSGQLTKILNNMILFETVLALSEAASIAEKYGIKVESLFNNITKCSADSFALRNHGLKSIAQKHFPTQAFSSEYALKDLSYALKLGKSLNIKLPGALTSEKVSVKSKVFQWFNCVAYSTLAALLGRMIIFPAGVLSDSELMIRLIVLITCVAIFIFTKKNLVIPTILSAIFLSILNNF